MNESDLSRLAFKLKDKNMTIAFAESITGGMLISEFVKAKGTSDVLLGSIVTYAEEVKQKVLGVKKQTLKLYTAESQQVTNEMVMGLYKLLKADICVAVTGLCGAGASENKEKPVGTVFFSILCRNKVEEYRELFDGNSEGIRKKAAEFIFQKIEATLDRHFEHA
ncbi:CinA family protein [Adhaeribacter rhizoryzae]|uniref:CinA family protein n=1 Tax=Adhaeribacter rhizoryzae TaxID=2607907 RepID=A0A5M6DPS1_9BACT|nr:CinA family protein [Adhaeribacter rhizoryzae]KAA5548242.1 CinA family protein [Adhaeribacter rhizoryzae]